MSKQVAAGYRMRGDEHRRNRLLVSAAFRRAHERGWTSVSFPGISSGIFAVPPEVCARTRAKYEEALRRLAA